MLFAFLLWSLFFCEIYYHSIFKLCVGSGGGGGVWEGGKGLRCSCVSVFLLKCGTALKNIELDIHFLDNHSGFEFRLF